ncbi:MAG: ead/Ea22-like family protein [Klebsiella michiganensis]|nr:ead/Ea22-like family protein [Klebsiella michiganensis]
MTTNITELAQSLKAAAEKATPGEWVYFPKNTSIEYDVGSDESQGSILYVDSGDFTKAQTDRNGEFIALANPANVIALVEALDKSEKTSEARREAIDRTHNMFVRERDRANVAEEALEKAQTINAAPAILRQLAEEKQKRGEVAAATAFNYAASALQKELSK